MVISWHRFWLHTAHKKHNLLFFLNIVSYSRLSYKKQTKIIFFLTKWSIWILVLVLPRKSSVLNSKMTILDLPEYL